MNADDIELALRSRAAFNESVDRIDADTRTRLRDLRRRAQQGEARRAGARWVWPAGAALTAALALAVFLPRLPQVPAVTIFPVQVAVVPQPAASALADHGAATAVAQAAAPASIDASSTEAPAVEAADPDMLSDLDFYGWLAKQQDTGKSGG